MFLYGLLKAGLVQIAFASSGNSAAAGRRAGERLNARHFFRLGGRGPLTSAPRALAELGDAAVQRRSGGGGRYDEDLDFAGAEIDFPEV